MKKTIRLVCGISAAVVLAGCTAGQTPGPPINAVNPNYGKLQFAVGTANLYGSITGLNVASTLRQPNGRSAYGVDTPAITGPFTFAAGAAPANGSLSDPYSTFPNNGPSLAESSGTPAITSTSQTVHPGTPFCDGIGTVPPGFTSCPGGISPNASTFGESGGVFAMGIAPYNTVAETSQSFSYSPYAQPLYETAGHLQFVPWGGPPAFDPDGNGMGTRDGLNHLDVDSFNKPYFLGVGEGVTTFEGVTPATGTYNLSVVLAIAGGGGPQFLTLSTNASLNSLALLPTVTAPVVTPDANGDGGATLNAVLPAGVTEAYVQIVDYGPGGGPAHGGAAVGNCHGPKGEAFAPVYYTIHVTQSGAATLGTSNGPNTNVTGGVGGLTPSHSICTLTDNQNPPDNIPPVSAGDNFTVQLIGFDYPIYQAALSLIQPNTTQTPQIAGASGQADITVSVPVEEDYPNYNVQIPLSRIRHSTHHARFTHHRK